MTNYNLSYNLYQGIIQNKKIGVLSLIIVLIILQACIKSFVSYGTFAIMNNLGNQDKHEVVKWIMIIAISESINEFLNYIELYIYRSHIDIKMNKYFLDKYLEILFLKSDYEWLNCNKTSEINTAIHDGTRALITTLRSIIRGLNPLLQAIGSIIVISSHIGFNIVILFIIMVSVFLAGIKLLEWEYTIQQRINKETNPLTSYNIHLSNTILGSILNDNGERSINTISTNTLRKKKLIVELQLATSKWYSLLDIFGMITIMLAIYYMSYTEDIETLVAINSTMYMIYYRMWRLFHTYHRAASDAAEWATLGEYLENIVYRVDKGSDIKEMVEYSLKEPEINTILLNTQINELRIYGESGAGKSTWMLAQVIYLCKHYNLCWLYLEQEMVVPSSSSITIRQYLCEYISCDYGYEQYVLNWAEYLQLTSIININTLDKSFNSPSGGEKKRINILRMLIPILINEHSIKLLFIDEITSGLDDKTHNIIRRLILKLQNEYGIKIINIDHHNIYTPHYQVFIKLIEKGKKSYKASNKKYYSHKSYCKCLNSNYIKYKDTPNEISYPPTIGIDKIVKNN